MKNIKISNQMIIVLALSFVMLIAFATLNYRSRKEKSEKAHKTEVLIVTLKSAKQLVHDLQRERGFSAGFVGSKGEKFSAELKEHRTQTDISYQDYLKNVEIADKATQNSTKIVGIADLGEELVDLTSELNNMLARFKTTDHQTQEEKALPGITNKLLE